jgi:uncharacterized membrane protein
LIKDLNTGDLPAQSDQQPFVAETLPSPSYFCANLLFIKLSNQKNNARTAGRK